MVTAVAVSIEKPMYISGAASVGRCKGSHSNEVICRIIFAGAVEAPGSGAGCHGSSNLSHKVALRVIIALAVA